MAVTDFILTPWAIPVAVILYYLVPYLTSNTGIRNVPGPSAAKFSNLWLLLQARQGKRYQSVDEAHKKYGKLVRIQPNHVSVADESAINAIYGHGNGFLKSDFYDVFVSITRGLFNTRDRAEHTRKRKTVSHTFSTKSIAQFETYMHQNLDMFVKQWDTLSQNAHGGFAKIDSLHWFNYLAFDMIGDLAFGQPFGMLEKGKDITEIRMTPESPVTYAPAVEVLNRRGEVSGTLGCLPGLKPWAKYLPDPFFSQGLAAVQNLAGIAVARVSQRLDGKSDPGRVDLLARLMEGKDENGKPMGRQELTAEALTQLIAGSDTTSNTSCAILYWILKTPGVLQKLQKELDAAIPEDIDVPSFEMVKDLPYLHNVIQETMRIHSTSALGLPRVVPPGPGITLLGQHFPAYTVLSVPSYTIHHSPEIWGPDVEEFKPERWDRLTERQKTAFIPFSYGPRSCVGRNVAEMELALIVGTAVGRYEFELYTERLETREGFLRKPLECLVGVRKRGARA
ncbi:Cytochrome P450 [Glarea lozoyensis ATCC 20868]|uniref:Benzoate 4-monooxygenase bphA n=2 Tax=Glarea lozoyensis TaxID=101852 RepID=S3DF34_GLAL2|nr:Cytochrome P450 [Glarea lozoyensis ATCC 20868]EHK98820.1 putative Benzoate 4-monooxygenase [Glarea lozoyensis 74030]EPE36350.1 Cytochrome P450 [Glarea lozoyensis ATCC 20868]